MSAKSPAPNSERDLHLYETTVLRRFDDTRWMRRGEIDPFRIYGKELRILQARGLVVRRKPHDFDPEYALTEAGLAAQRKTRS